MARGRHTPQALPQKKDADSTSKSNLRQKFFSTKVLIPQLFCRLGAGAQGDQSDAGMEAGCDVKEDMPVGLLEGDLNLHDYDLIPHPVTLKGPPQMEAAWFLATESTAM